MHEARKIFRMQDTLHMRRGGLLEGVEIAYETWGELNAARSNAILIFTGLSPSAHAASSVRDTSAGWWEDMIGPGKPFDSNFHEAVMEQPTEDVPPGHVAQVFQTGYTLNDRLLRPAMVAVAKAP